MKTTICSKRQLIKPCTLPGFNYQIDTYIGCEHYCYYCYALNSSESNWQEEIGVYRNIKKQLLRELENIPPQSIYFGYHSDPYQPLEGSLGQTRRALKILQELGFSASLLTKSNLFLRDIDILKEMPEANVSISVAFDDNEIRKRFEKNTIKTDCRIEALSICKEERICTSAIICPVIPHKTNVKKLISKLDDIADRIWVYRLSLQNENDESYQNVKKILKQNFPDEAQEIEKIVKDDNHNYWKDLRKELENIHDTRILVHL